MLRPLRVICLIMLFAAWHGSAADQPSVADQAISIADTLSKKLNSLGSFRVDYDLVSTNTLTNAITLTYNASRKFGLLRMTVPSGSNAGTTCYCLIDASGFDGEHGSYDMLIVSPEFSRRLRIPIRDMLESLDNPIGIMSLIAKQCRKDEETAMAVEAPSKTLAASILIDLNLTETDMNTSLGLSSKDRTIHACWLDPKVVTNVLDISETSNTVEFSYSGSHVVSVDKDTGLLLRDSCPRTGRPGPREIVMSRISFTVPDEAYATLIPGFDPLAIEDMPATTLINQMNRSFLEGLGAQLAGITNLDARLVEHRSAITNNIRTMAREMHMDAAREFIRKDQQLIASMAPALRNAYLKAIETQPTVMSNMTFSTFIDSMLSSDESTVRKTWITRFDKSLHQDCESMFAHLPEALRIALTNVHEIGMPAVNNGILDAFTWAFAEAVKEWDAPHGAEPISTAASHSRTNTAGVDDP